MTKVKTKLENIFVTDNIKFSGRIPKEGIDFEENPDTFTIFNVPILAEMVQFYEAESLDDQYSGYAYKPADEILRVKVNNVPLTIVDYSPTHPTQLISQMGTMSKTDVIVGYMSEPSRPKGGMSKTKRYADFVLSNTPKIDMLKETYKRGEFIDTSVGIRFKGDFTPGIFMGENYDYVQRDLSLDHNAILIDRVGNLGVGRMPSPIGGIGADSNNKKLEENKVSEELKTQLDSALKENVELQKQLDEAKNADVQETIDSLKTDAETAKTDAEKAKSDLKEATDKLEEAGKELKVFKDAEAEAFTAKVDALKEANPTMKELFDTASKEVINTKYDELLENKGKQTAVGTDMFRANKSNDVKPEGEKINGYFGVKKKE